MNSPQFTFNVSDIDSKKSFSEMSNVRKNNKSLLLELKKDLKTDPLNPIYLNNLANFYKNTGDEMLSKEMFSNAFNNWFCRINYE